MATRPPGYRPSVGVAGLRLQVLVLLDTDLWESWDSWKFRRNSTTPSHWLLLSVLEFAPSNSLPRLQGVGQVYTSSMNLYPFPQWRGNG